MNWSNTSRTVLASVVAALLSATLIGCNSRSADRSPDRAVGNSTAMKDAPAAPDRGASGESASPTPTDVALVGKVESALAAETALHGSAIAVKADDGVVTLTGSTKDPELRSMAAQVALSVTGVRSVRNELTISADV